MSGSWGWTLGRVHDLPPLQTWLCSSSTDLRFSYQNISVIKYFCRQNIIVLKCIQGNISQSDQSSLTNCPHYIIFCEVQSTPRIVSIKCLINLLSKFSRFPPFEKEVDHLALSLPPPLLQLSQFSVVLTTMIVNIWQICVFFLPSFYEMFKSSRNKPPWLSKLPTYERCLISHHEKLCASEPFRVRVAPHQKSQWYNALRKS